MSLKVKTRTLLWTQIYLLLTVRFVSGLINFNAIVYVCDVVNFLILLLLVKRCTGTILNVSVYFLLEIGYWTLSFMFGKSGNMSAFIMLMRVFARFFVIFAAAERSFKKEDYFKLFKLFDYVLAVHFVLILFQVFVLRISNGDAVGGIFGVRFGYGNASSHTLIILTMLITSFNFFSRREEIYISAIKFSMMFGIAMLTEMKAFIFEAALIIGLFLLLENKVRKRTGLIILAIPFAAVVFMNYMEANYGFSIFDINSINEYLERGYGYNRDGIGRIDGFEKIYNNCFEGDIEKTLFGFGFATSISNFTAEYYSKMNLGNFTYGKLFYDTGAVGCLIYFSFFIVCIVKAFKLRRRDRMLSTFSVVLGFICIYLNFYGNHMESDFCGYLYYMLLAIPSLKDNKNSLQRGIVL